jgi:hypothetical protein
LVVGYRRFGTTHQLVSTAWALKVGSVGFPETSVTTNQCCVTSHKSGDLNIKLDVPKQMKVNVDDKKAFNTFEKYL